VYNHDALRLSNWSSLVLNRFTFPWFDWNPADPGPWNLEFEAEAAISESAGLPACLRNAVMRIENGRVTNGSLSADLRVVPLSDCRIPIVAGHNIVVSSIGGSVASLYQPDPAQPFTATADFYMQSRYEAGSPLFCQDDAAAQQTTADITFSSGKMVGTLAIDDTGCRIPIGMMEAELNQASLSLFVDDGLQQAHLASQATLKLSQADAVQGNFLFDIRQRKFLELDFAITRPFRWDIPSDQEPVLTFLVNQASLSLDGLYVDGRQQVEVSGHRFGVTFDRVLVDLYDWNIRSGEIFFDEHFAFAVSLDEGLSSPKFTAVRLTEDQAQIPLPTYGLYMELGADVVVDSMGIRTTGRASASVSIGDFSYEDLSITFTDDFALQFKPFGVAEGRADFYFRDSRVAYFDAAGFTPLVSGFANEILPEKLPLPSRERGLPAAQGCQRRPGRQFRRAGTGDHLAEYASGYPAAAWCLPILDPQNPPVDRRSAVRGLLHHGHTG
jgi:large repetitive protein